MKAPVDVTFRATGVEAVQRGLQNIGKAGRTTGNSLNLLAASAAAGQGSLAGMATAAGNLAQGMAEMSKKAGIAASAVGIGLLVASVGLLIELSIEAKKKLSELPDGVLTGSATTHIANLRTEKDLQQYIALVEKQRAAAQAKMGGVAGDADKQAQHIANLDAQREAAFKRMREITNENRQREIEGIKISADAQITALTKYHGQLRVIEAERMESIRKHELSETAANQRAAAKQRQLAIETFIALETLRTTWVSRQVARLASDDDPKLSPRERLSRYDQRTFHDQVRGQEKSAFFNMDGSDASGAGTDMVADINARKALGSGYRAIKDNLYADGKKKAQVLGDEMEDQISSIIGPSIASGFEAAFQQGNIGAGFAALTASLLGGIGGLMEQLGEQMVVVGLGLRAFAAAILSLNGGAAIAAGVGLIAGGALLKSVAGSIGGGGAGGGGGSIGGSGGYSSSGGFAQIIDRGVINPSNITPRTPMTFNLGLFSPNDAGSQRFVDEVNRRIGQNGSLAGSR